jgi:hypothetical protein
VFFRFSLGVRKADKNKYLKFSSIFLPFNLFLSHSVNVMLPYNVPVDRHALCLPFSRLFTIQGEHY